MAMQFLSVLALLALTAGDVTIKEFVAPQYPPVAKAAHIEATIEVQVVINSDGLVANAQSDAVLSPLKIESVNNAYLWTFNSGENGRQVTIIYQFKLEGTPSESVCTRIKFRSPLTIIISTTPQKFQTSAARKSRSPVRQQE
jgi:hypothetical protein